MLPFSFLNSIKAVKLSTDCEYATSNSSPCVSVISWRLSFPSKTSPAALRTFWSLSLERRFTRAKGVLSFLATEILIAGFSSLLNRMRSFLGHLGFSAAIQGSFLAYRFSMLLSSLRSVRASKSLGTSVFLFILVAGAGIEPA